VIYLGVFGSMARGDQNEGSDVDLLVKFSPENRSGLFALSAMRDELQGVLGRKVDLLTEGFLSKYFRDEVLSQTKTLYVKT
jgi:predicted nucleotidyltransferase